VHETPLVLKMFCTTPTSSEGDGETRREKSREELYFCTIPTGGGAAEMGGERVVS